jgi:hypothetical protein
MWFLRVGIVGGRAIKLNIVVLSKFKMLKEAVFRNFCDRQATTGKHLTNLPPTMPSLRSFYWRCALHNNNNILLPILSPQGAA